MRLTYYTRKLYFPIFICKYVYVSQVVLMLLPFVSVCVPTKYPMTPDVH